MSDWICTGECRYVTGMEVISDHDGITSAREFKQLQQKWKRTYAHGTQYEWRNVPVVSE